MKILLQTLRALTAHRRAIPLALVLLSVLAVEWFTTGSAASVGIDVLMFAAFCFVGPASWRALGAPQRSSRVGLLAGLGSYFLINGVTVGTIGLVVPLALGRPWTYVIEPPSLAIVLVLFVVGGWGLGRDIDLEEGLDAERARAERLAVEAEHAQLLALRAQLDPHFLFNTLNAIAEWCREDPEVAETALLKLAAMLRSILEGIRRSAWSLSEELDLLQDLFELYRVRDHRRYRLEARLPEHLPEVDVPPMLLLPLFENAITHGPSAGHDGALRLRLTTSASTLMMEIVNPGAYSGRREGGEGIGIAQRRLKLAFGSAGRLTIRSSGSETVTVVTIPHRSHPEAGS